MSNSWREDLTDYRPDRFITFKNFQIHYVKCNTTYYYNFNSDLIYYYQHYNYRIIKRKLGTLFKNCNLKERISQFHTQFTFRLIFFHSFLLYVKTAVTCVNNGDRRFPTAKNKGTSLTLCQNSCIECDVCGRSASR